MRFRKVGQVVEAALKTIPQIVLAYFSV